MKNFNNPTYIIYTYHIIHNEALVDKKIDPELNKVLQDTVTLVNFIRGQELNSRLLSKQCKAWDPIMTNSFMQKSVGCVDGKCCKDW
jgi:hypothetical protein